LRRRQQEATRFADAEASAQDLVRRVQDLRHKVEMRVSTSGARVKSAPFEGAATLQSLKPSTDVVVLIISLIGSELKLRMATMGGSARKSWSLCRELANRKICILRVVVLVAAAFPVTNLQAQSEPVERAFTEPRADVEKAVTDVKAHSSGKLPALEGFVGQTQQPVERYERAYYQCLFQ